MSSKNLFKNKLPTNYSLKKRNGSLGESNNMKKKVEKVDKSNNWFKGNISFFIHRTS